MKSKKRSPLKFSPIISPNLGAGLKQTSSPTLCVLKASAQLTKGGGHASILHAILRYLYYPGDPKAGGPWPNGPPPKYTPGSVDVVLLPDRLIVIRVVLSYLKQILRASVFSEQVVVLKSRFVFTIR